MLYKRLIAQPPYIAPESPTTIGINPYYSSLGTGAFATFDTVLGSGPRYMKLYNVDPTTGVINTTPSLTVDWKPSGLGSSSTSYIPSGVYISPNGRKVIAGGVNPGNPSNPPTGYNYSLRTTMYTRTSDTGAWVLSNPTLKQFLMDRVVWCSDNTRWISIGNQNPTVTSANNNGVYTNATYAFKGAYWGSVTDAGVITAGVAQSNNGDFGLAFSMNNQSTCVVWLGNDVVFLNTNSNLCQSLTYGTTTLRTLTITGDYIGGPPTNSRAIRISDTRFLTYGTAVGVAVILDWRYDSVSGVLTNKIVTNTLIGSSATAAIVASRYANVHQLDDDTIQLVYFDGIRYFNQKYFKTGDGAFIPGVSHYTFPTGTASPPATNTLYRWSHSSGKKFYYHIQNGVLNSLNPVP